MKKKVEEDVGHYYSKKNLNIILSILIVLLALIAIYFSFFYEKECESFECFKTAMEKCSEVSYVNEAPEASWGYEIEGKENEQCEIEVTLLLAKKGELEIDRLVGYEMSCFYPEGVGTYPEKDLRNCHGRLKEELQEIIINKLHSYIIENLGQIDQKINAI